MRTQRFLYFALLLALVLPPATTLALAPEAGTFSINNQSIQFNGMLYFPVFEPADPLQQYNIVKLDLVSGNREVILERASQPAVSHAGTAITYKSWVPDQQVYGLHAAQLSDLATTDWRYSNSMADQRPQWAPNDSFFYFYTRKESDRQDRLMITQGAQASGIFRPDMDNKETLGKSPAVVTVNGGYGIEYQACEFSNCGIWQRAINGTNPVQITDQPSDQGLSASADGSAVAFMSYDRDGASDWEVYVMAADGSNLKRLTNRPGIDGIPTWSSDGKWIAFVRERDPGSNQWDIMAIRPDGTGETRLAELGVLNGQVKGTTPDQCLGWIEESISWTGTGATAEAETAEPEAKPTALPAETAEPAEAAPTPEPAQPDTAVEQQTPEPTIVAETNVQEAKPEPTTAAEAATGGKLRGTIAFPVFDDANGRFNYDLMKIDLGSLQQTKVLVDASQPSLSSDGTWIAYKAWGQDRKQQGLHAAALVDLEETDWQFTAAQEAQHPSWAPGDLFFSFYSRQESDRNNRVMITAGTQAVTIKRPDVDNKEIEGRTPLVYFGKDKQQYIMYQGCEKDTCGVWSRTLGGGNPIQLTEDTSDQAFSLSPDGQRVAFMSYTREDAQDWEVYVMATDGSQTTRLTERPGNDGLPVWSPDGAWIAFVRETKPDSNQWDVMVIRPDGTGESKLFTLGALDGRVKGSTDDQNGGWLEEQISWGNSDTNQ